MKALVLSAGYGERLRPLTDRIPKPLLEVGGRPLIHYPLLMLRAAGITEIAINVHHLGAQIEHALGDGAALGVRITYSPEPILAGTGGPLIALRDFFGDDTFALLNCDTILDLDLERVIAFHRARGGAATFVLRDGDDPDAYSRIECDAAGRVQRMRLIRGRERGVFDDYPATIADDAAAALAPYMYCGVMIAEPAVCAAAPATPPFSLMSDLFAPIIARGMPVYGYAHRGTFRTVDDRAGYDRLCAEFASAPPQFAYLR